MFIVKFIVLFGCISVFSALQTNYCDICTNHTMCQYTVPGPSTACKLYDSTALLSSKEKNELINKINERRNFIALGYSTVFPQASNMKKIHWSSELELFAQRWADQCDPFLHPDREDICRNLENTEVGQNVGSVSGTTPGLNVKSFVEMWLMEILDYGGSVTYYNQSRDDKTKYLTQLIWAESEYVGCGKVKFYIHERKMNIVRLVCNFAPKGNINGRPVYAIGYAGTQCPNKMVPDKEYRGLCNYQDTETIAVKQSTEEYPVTSLLRVLNLSNDTVKQEIDPIRNNFKAKSQNNNKNKNQKTRHITSNNSGTVRRISLHKINMRTNLQNITRNMKNYNLRQHKEGNSHLFRRNEEPHLVLRYTTTRYFHGNMMPSLQTYDYTPPSIHHVSNANYVNHNINKHCTRNIAPNCCNTLQCTRGQHHCCQQVTSCQAETFTNPILPNTICPQIPICPSTCANICPIIYPHSFTAVQDCECSTHIQLSPCCQNIPNMIRSGEQNFSTSSDSDQYYDYKTSEVQKIKHNKQNPDQLNKHLNDEINEQNRDYFYRSIDSSYREKRDMDNEVSVIPFWKFKEINHKNTLELKSLSYTTLPLRKKINTRKNLQAIIQQISTEPITITKEEYSNNENDEEIDNEEKTTEKFLSFDELMYLRKLTNNYTDYYPRRQGGLRRDSKKSKPTPKSKLNTTSKATTLKSTPKTEKTTLLTSKKKPSLKPLKNPSAPSKNETKSEYTLNTTFKPKKQCTRKLTCTWTAFTNIAENGNNVGILLDIGSRTPPGYVEGCSRTSTCTRDFLNRNKMATALDENETHSDTMGDDEEYCEKRSLKVYRRNSDYKVRPDLKKNVNSHKTSIINLSSSTLPGSVCKNKIRMKRQKILSSKDVSKVISYADLYYLALNKIMKASDAESCNIHRCGCNQSSTYTIFSFRLIWFIILIILESSLLE